MKTYALKQSWEKYDDVCVKKESIEAIKCWSILIDSTGALVMVRTVVLRYVSLSRKAVKLVNSF